MLPPQPGQMACGKLSVWGKGPGSRSSSRPLASDLSDHCSQENRPGFAETHATPGRDQEGVCPLVRPQLWTLHPNFCDDALSLSTREMTLKLGQGHLPALDRPQKRTDIAESR